MESINKNKVYIFFIEASTTDSNGLTWGSMIWAGVMTMVVLIIIVVIVLKRRYKSGSRNSSDLESVIEPHSNVILSTTNDLPTNDERLAQIHT